MTNNVEPAQGLGNHLAGMGKMVTEGPQAVTPAPLAEPPTAVAMLPEKSRQIALARADLLRLYRRAAAQAATGQVVAAKDKFLEAYNLGAYPKLFALLKYTSRLSVERWDRIMRRSGDPWDLAPHWGEHRRGRRSLNEDQAKILLAVALHPHRLPINEVIRAARGVMAARGIANGHSDSTYRRWLQDFQERHFDLWTFYRKGEKALNDECIPYLIRDYAKLQVGDALVADGHKFNATILNPWTGQPCRMTLILFYDMKANYPLGWELMPTENTQAIAAALRRAILQLGKCPKCVYLDNGKAFGSKHFSAPLSEAGIGGMFERLGIMTIFARPYHAQSKTVERFFGSFAELERRLPSYSGTSIDNKPAHLKRGEKIHRAMMQKLSGGFVPTMEQANLAIGAWFDEYAGRRQTSGSHLAGLTPREVFEPARGPGVDPVELRELMLSEEIRRVSRAQISLPGKRFYRHPELYGRNHPVVIRYDSQDPASILVYETTGEFVCEALLEGGVHPIAKVTGTDADRQELADKLAQQASLKRSTTGAARAFAEAVVIPEGRKLLEDQGLAGDPGTGAGVKDSLTVPRRRQAKIEYTPGEVEQVQRDLAESGAGGVVFEAEAAAVIELPEAVDEAELLYAELDAKGDVERYDRLQELEAQGYLLPKKYLLFMRYFEATDSYERQRDYYAERRAKLAVCFQVG